jgi:hypothetical protein
MVCNNLHFDFVSENQIKPHFHFVHTQKLSDAQGFILVVRGFPGMKHLGAIQIGCCALSEPHSA